MRGSILFPDRHRVRLMGIAGFGLAAFLLFAAFLISPLSLSKQPTSHYTTQITGLEKFGNISGPVYLLDENNGEVNIIGQFRSNENGGEIELLIAHPLKKENITGFFWEARPSSYIPHFRFVFNDDLQNRLQLVSEAAWKDEAVQKSFNTLNDELFRVFQRQLGPMLTNLFKTPDISDALLDAGLTVIARDQESKFAEESRKSLQNVIMEYLKNIKPGELASELMENPEFYQAIDNLSIALEPHIRLAMDEILWYSPRNLPPTSAGVPNARLIWVARRVIFGGRTNALLLMPDPLGMPLTDTPFVCREAQ